MGFKLSPRNIISAVAAPFTSGLSLLALKDTKGNTGLDYVTGAKSAREMEQRQKQYQDATNQLSIDLANSAHQREVADLKAAGLNPVLSAGGSGSTTPTLGTAIAQNENPGGLATSAMQAGQAAQMFTQAKLNMTNKELAPDIADAQNDLAHAQAQTARDQHEFYEDTGYLPGATESNSGSVSGPLGLGSSSATTKSIRNTKKGNSARTATANKIENKMTKEKWNSMSWAQKQMFPSALYHKYKNQYE